MIRLRFRKDILKTRFVQFLFAGLLLLCFESRSFAAIDPGAEASQCFLDSLLKQTLSKSFGGARIELNGTIKWVKGDLPVQCSELIFLGDDSRGNAHFSVLNSLKETKAEGWVGFAAWQPTQVALRRIHPGELLSSDLVVRQEVNIAVGQAHEYRGVILPDTVPLVGLEAVQTILEGQFLLSSALKRVPDIRRGDSVQIHIITGGIVLSTSGIAEEPSYIHGKVRVMTGKTKRELLGRLLPGGVVEVKL